LISRSIFDLPQKQQKLLELQDKMSDPNLWSDRQKATDLGKQVKYLETEILEWQRLESDFQSLTEIANESYKTHDYSMKGDFENKYKNLKKVFDEFKVNVFLSGKYDQNDCIMSIHAGAGGTDAQDWVQMLFRMFSRYCQNHSLELNVIDQTRGGEAGIKSIVFEILGLYAYGHLKSEAGVHRLVRQSPFNPTHTRETSFALVEVLPEVKEEEFKLNPDDLIIEAKTSRGHGGQSVNTTYSAIRMTHKPSGITVTIQNERSQTQNKEQAYKILSARLAAIEQEKREEDKRLLRGEYHSAEWGNQIRSYVLHPYKLVKDHRTDFETSNTEEVLEGNLDEFIKNYLEKFSKK
jgi:peptide chain release factor 2